MADKGKPKDKARTGRVWRILRRLAIFFSILIVVGVRYQSKAMEQDREKFPPPGEFVDVGGYKLHIYCVGEGSPAVILEAGLGDNWLTWNKVQGDIASVTHVCSYDRAGLGWSDPAPGPLDSSQVAESLHTLLQNAQIPGPYVLVGHSAGGLYVRSFAQQFPEEVAGMVLVDSYHENQFFRLPKELVQSTQESYSGLVNTLSIVQSLAPFGVVRVLGLAQSFAEGDPVGGSLSPEDFPMLIALYNRSSFSRAVKYEYETEALNVDEPRPLPNLGDIPLTVITKTGADIDTPPPGITRETMEQANQTQMELQQELVGLSTNGTLVVVEDTGHHIQIDRPEIVIEEIIKMVESLQ